MQCILNMYHWNYLVGHVLLDVNPCGGSAIVSLLPQIEKLSKKLQQNDFKICELRWVGRLTIFWMYTIILAKYGRTKDIHRIKYQDCTRLPITRTLFLMKKEWGAHLKSIETDFQLHETELETKLKFQATTIIPQLNNELFLKLLYKLLTQTIHKIKHISLPNGTHLMSHTDFQTYYKTPTKLIKNALHIAEQFFCQQSCTQNCLNQCSRHPQTRTLPEKYISDNRELIPRIWDNPLYPPQPQQPNPPPT